MLLVIDRAEKEITAKIADGQVKFKEKFGEEPNIVYIDGVAYSKLGELSRYSSSLKIKTLEYVPPGELWFGACALYAY